MGKTNINEEKMTTKHVSRNAGGGGRGGTRGRHFQVGHLHKPLGKKTERGPSIRSEGGFGKTVRQHRGGLNGGEKAAEGQFLFLNCLEKSHTGKKKRGERRRWRMCWQNVYSYTALHEAEQRDNNRR